MGDVVVIHLSDFHLRRLGRVLGTSEKLLGEWSLPMRVIFTNGERTTATVQCMATGWVTRVHLRRTAFLRKPQSAEMLADWGEVMNAEKTLLQVLNDRVRETKQGRRADASVRGLNVANNLSLSTSTTAKVAEKSGERGVNECRVLISQEKESEEEEEAGGEDYYASSTREAPEAKRCRKETPQQR